MGKSERQKSRIAEMSKIIASACKKLWQGVDSYENKSVDAKQKARFDQVLADLEERTAYRDSVKADGNLKRVREQRAANKGKALGRNEKNAYQERM